MPETVTLKGGPFDGAEVDVTWGTPLLCQGEPVPEGMVARYCKSRERGVYAFREYDRVVMTLPLPGSKDSA
jgi:hypothetical protein